jgi:hypothetical protein
MKKKNFLYLTLIIVFFISGLATMYPLEAFTLSLMLMPIVLVWCVATTPKKGDE